MTETSCTAEWSLSVVEDNAQIRADGDKSRALLESESISSQSPYRGGVQCSSAQDWSRQEGVGVMRYIADNYLWRWCHKDPPALCLQGVSLGINIVRRTSLSVTVKLWNDREIKIHSLHWSDWGQNSVSNIQWEMGLQTMGLQKCSLKFCFKTNLYIQSNS